MPLITLVIIESLNGLQRETIQRLHICLAKPQLATMIKQAIILQDILQVLDCLKILFTRLISIFSCKLLQDFGEREGEGWQWTSRRQQVFVGEFHSPNPLPQGCQYCNLMVLYSDQLHKLMFLLFVINRGQYFSKMLCHNISVLFLFSCASYYFCKHNKVS